MFLLNTLPAYGAVSSGSVSAVIDSLVTVPSQYYTLSLITLYLALDDGSPVFKQL